MEEKETMNLLNDLLFEAESKTRFKIFLALSTLLENLEVEQEEAADFFTALGQIEESQKDKLDEYYEMWQKSLEEIHNEKQEGQ